MTIVINEVMMPIALAMLRLLPLQRLGCSVPILAMPVINYMRILVMLRQPRRGGIEAACGSIQLADVSTLAPQKAVTYLLPLR